MKGRALIGSLIWVFGFNLFVAGVAYFWSVGWAVLILLLRHVLLGFPNLYNKWRAIILGREQYLLMSPVNKEWPNQIWILGTAVGILITIASFIWVNQPLKTLLARI